MTRTMLEPPALFFLANYILWSVGKLELEINEELDGMTPRGMENWKCLMQRKCPWSRDKLRTRFNELSETVSEEDALEILFQEVGFEKA